MSSLTQKKCQACEGIGQALSEAQIQTLFPQLHKDWRVVDHKKLLRIFHFRNFYETMAFVNAMAWIAHQENHHPDLMISYSSCHISYTTHALDGLSQNDFICAAKVDQLYSSGTF